MKRGQQKRGQSRKATPDFPIRIDRISHEGRGLVRWGERMLFVDGALPGELVQVKITQKSSKVADGVAVAILDPSPTRQTPSCPYAERCGGCSLQHMPHADQLAHKINTLHALMSKEGVSLSKVQQLPTLTAALRGYRRRARLGVRWVRAKERVLVGFREKASNFIADINGCEVMDARIGQSLTRLAETIAATSIPDRIPQIEVAAGDDVLAIVIRHLEPLSESDIKLFEDLGPHTGWHIYLQPKGPDSIHRLWPLSGPTLLTYRIGELGLEYRFEVTDFTQINAQINQKMVLAALDLLDLKGTERVLDLFCGLGNFTLAAATRAAEVTGVEVSETMVQRVLDNAAHNGLENVSAVAFDLTQSIEAQAFAQAAYDTLIVDPPRSGAKEVLEALPMKQCNRVLYVSCNPATLARDAAILIDRGFRMTHLGIMDMFPETAHVESMALFVRSGTRG